MGSKKTRAAVSAVTYILISILAVICVFPFFWMLISALKPKDEIRSAVPSLLIDNPTIDNFRRWSITAFLPILRTALSFLSPQRSSP